MTFSVYIVFDDGTRDLAKETPDLTEAVEFALIRADKLGNRDRGAENDLSAQNAGHGCPTKIDVYSNDKREISIRIMRGGHWGRTGAPKLRAI